MPKSYGAPTGAPPVDTKRKQKEAKPASDAQVGSYIDHMVAADKAYHDSKSSSSPTPRGSSSYDSAGKYKMPTGLRGKQIDEATKKAGG